MSDKLLTAWCWLPNPGSTWRVHEMMSGLTVDASSKAEAVEHFTRLWNSRSRLEWRFEAPPQPRRAEPKPAGAALEGDSLAVVFHRALVKEFHSDRVGHRALSSDAILSVINRLWDEATAK
jgi:hypothetical protein